jgi:hypothetical protein
VPTVHDYFSAVRKAQSGEGKALHFSVQGTQFSFLTYLPVSCRTEVIMFLPRNASEPIDGAYDVVKQVKIKATHW